MFCDQLQGGSAGVISGASQENAETVWVSVVVVQHNSVQRETQYMCMHCLSFYVECTCV